MISREQRGGRIAKYIVAAATLFGIAGWLILRDNTMEYRYKNRYAMTVSGDMDSFRYIVVGTPESPYTGDLDFFLLLSDGSAIDLRSPEIPELIKKCGEGVTASPAREGGAKWPPGSMIYQNTPSREFLIAEGKLLAVTVRLDRGSREKVEFKNKKGMRYTMPLSREEMEAILGAGGEYRSFLRQ